MANFEQAYELLLKHEGGYVFNKNDAGQETIYGISRKYNPTWPGWQIVDSKKDNKAFPQNLYADTQLKILTKAFYRKNYWDKIQGDFIDDQINANQIFDFAVNAGVQKCIVTIQYILGIEQDGFIGPETLSHINVHDEEILQLKFKVERTHHYLRCVKDSPKNIMFLVGWLSRVYD